METSYTIVKKIMIGITLRGFIIEDNEGTRHSVMISDVVKLIQNNKVTNASLVLDTDTAEYIISVDGGLDKLPIERNVNELKLKIVCRIMNSANKCIAYKAVDSSGNAHKLGIGKTWELAINGVIEGIEAILIDNKKVLRSTGETKLSDLPRVTADT